MLLPLIKIIESQDAASVVIVTVISRDTVGKIPLLPVIYIDAALYLIAEVVFPGSKEEIPPVLVAAGDDSDRRAAII